MFLFWKLYVYIKLIIAETYQSHNRVVRFRQILSILVFHVSKLYHHFIRYTISNFLHCVSRYGVLIEVPLSDINNIFTYASLIRKIVPPFSFSFLSPFLLLYNLMHLPFWKKLTHPILIFAKNTLLFWAWLQEQMKGILHADVHIYESKTTQ